MVSRIWGPEATRNADSCRPLARHGEMVAQPEVDKDIGKHAGV